MRLPGGAAKGSPQKSVMAAASQLGRSWDERPQLLTQPHEDIYRCSGTRRIFTWKFVQIASPLQIVSDLPDSKGNAEEESDMGCSRSGDRAWGDPAGGISEECVKVPGGSV